MTTTATAAAVCTSAAVATSVAGTAAAGAIGGALGTIAEAGMRLTIKDEEMNHDVKKFDNKPCAKVCMTQ